MQTNLRDLIRYKFDNMMSRGVIALVGVLFMFTAAVVIVAGILLVIFSDGGLGINIWRSVMHVIDPGTITGDDTDDFPFLILMSLVTLCGIFIFSILIGIITTAFKERLSTLKRGSSKVIEKGHTLILGFNDNAYTIISELIKANDNQSDACVVILTCEDMDETKLKISQKIKNLGCLRVVYRNGNIADSHMLSQCAIEHAKSVIVNCQDDFLITKTMLAINNYFSDKSGNLPHVVAPISAADNYDAICIAGGSYLEPILGQDIIARIIAQTCRHSGISNLLMELISYQGNELYFKNYPELEHKKFGDVLNLFATAIIFGIKRKDDIMLNPPMDLVLTKDDDLIVFTEDDQFAMPFSSQPKLMNMDFKAQPLSIKPTKILVLGINKLINSVLAELDHYFVAGSQVIIAANNSVDLQLGEPLKNIMIKNINCDTNQREEIKALLSNDIEHVLLLSNDDVDNETSDAMTLLKLIHLRDIAQKENYSFNITSEMKSTDNQKLAQIAKVNDLVVGSNIINLVMCQIAENRSLATVFRELLHIDGAEIYLRKASSYMPIGTEIDFYTITEILKQHNQIAIGYKRRVEQSYQIITNPLKSEKIIIEANDEIIVLASE